MVSEYFPSFLWVVRDFALKLVDEYKNEISSRQYLENALREQKGSSDAVEKKNKIRRLISCYFKDKDCFTLVRPTENEKDLQRIQKMEDSELRTEFMSQVHRLRQKVYRKIKPKSLHGRILTGSMFLELCQAYTESINKGSVPSINSAWTNLCKNENLRAINESIKMYEQEMNDQIY